MANPIFRVGHLGETSALQCLFGSRQFFDRISMYGLFALLLQVEPRVYIFLIILIEIGGLCLKNG